MQWEQWPDWVWHVMSWLEDLVPLIEFGIDG